jgi:hypothetical protein
MVNLWIKKKKTARMLRMHKKNRIFAFAPVTFYDDGDEGWRCMAT